MFHVNILDPYMAILLLYSCIILSVMIVDTRLNIPLNICSQVIHIMCPPS